MRVVGIADLRLKVGRVRTCDALVGRLWLWRCGGLVGRKTPELEEGMDHLKVKRWVKSSPLVEVEVRT